MWMTTYIVFLANMKKYYWETRKNFQFQKQRIKRIKYDDYLEKNDYSRDEITEGIKSICEEYGVSSMVEFLF